jgi:imidazole glycerol-phosphate synthase subunit HisH
LHATGMVEALAHIVRAGIPLFGICLGMQLLFESSEENGAHAGLGFLPGHVTRFPHGVDKVPHMGWNELTFDTPNHPLLQGMIPNDYVYFVHSYYVVPASDADICASTRYAGVRVPAMVGRGLVMGAQFHPEKSGNVGEQILQNFVNLCQTKPIQSGVTL